MSQELLSAAVSLHGSELPVSCLEQHETYEEEPQQQSSLAVFISESSKVAQNELPLFAFTSRGATPHIRPDFFQQIDVNTRWGGRVSYNKLFTTLLQYYIICYAERRKVNVLEMKFSERIELGIKTCVEQLE